MLATLLIIRQFLQNVKEVLQPYLYERHKLGELTLRAVWDLLLSVLLKYARLAAGKAMASPTDQTMPGPGLRGTRPGVGQPERRWCSEPFSKDDAVKKACAERSVTFMCLAVIHTNTYCVSHYKQSRSAADRTTLCRPPLLFTHRMQL